MSLTQYPSQIYKKIKQKQTTIEEKMEISQTEKNLKKTHSHHKD